MNSSLATSLLIVWLLPIILYIFVIIRAIILKVDGRYTSSMLYEITEGKNITWGALATSVFIVAIPFAGFLILILYSIEFIFIPLIDNTNWINEYFYNAGDEEND